MIAFAAWLWIQNLWALDETVHYAAAVQFTKYLLVFYFFYRLAAEATEATDILMVHVAGCFILGLLCFMAGRNLGDRLDGVGGPGIDDANTLGMFLAPGVITGATVFLSAAGWRRVVIVLAMPIILNGLILTGSRGAFLGLVAGGAIVFLLCPPERRWVFWGAAMLGVILAVRLVDQQFVERMLTIREAVSEQGEIDTSAESRLVLIEAQFRMAARYPHGTGHRGTAVLSPEYLEDRWLSIDKDQPDALPARSSHNTFMTVLVEQGIPGVIAYVWVMLWGVVVVVRLRRLQRRGISVEASAPAIAACAGIAVVWTAGQFTDYLLAEVQIWLLALLAASLDGIRQATADATTAPAVAEPPDGLVGAGQAS